MLPKPCWSFCSLANATQNSLCSTKGKKRHQLKKLGLAIYFLMFFGEQNKIN